MTAPGNSVVLLVLLALFVACGAYAAGRLHQRYRTLQERDEAYRDGYDSATRSVFSLAAQVIGPRRERTAIRASASVRAVAPEPPPPDAGRVVDGSVVDPSRSPTPVSSQVQPASSAHRLETRVHEIRVHELRARDGGGHEVRVREALRHVPPGNDVRKPEQPGPGIPESPSPAAGRPEASGGPIGGHSEPVSIGFPAPTPYAPPAAAESEAGSFWSPGLGVAFAPRRLAASMPSAADAAPNIAAAEAAPGDRPVRVAAPADPPVPVAVPADPPTGAPGLLDVESRAAESRAAGSRDAGSHDAESRAAGSRAAGSRAAGSCDAGSRDIGPPDAGPPDAGPSGAGRVGGVDDGAEELAESGHRTERPGPSPAASPGRHTVPDELVRAATYRLAPDRVARAKVHQKEPGDLPDDETSRLPDTTSPPADQPRTSVPKPRTS